MNDFDFGFSAVSEHEMADTKLEKMFNLILPLLNNLKANPEKAYIHWPNRVEKIDEFIVELNKIRVYKNYSPQK